MPSGPSYNPHLPSTDAVEFTDGDGQHWTVRCDGVFLQTDRYELRWQFERPASQEFTYTPPRELPNDPADLGQLLAQARSDKRTRNFVDTPPDDPFKKLAAEAVSDRVDYEYGYIPFERYTLLLLLADRITFAIETSYPLIHDHNEWLAPLVDSILTQLDL